MAPQNQHSRSGVRFALALTLCVLCGVRARAQPLLSVEAGPVFNSRNDVRIPGDGGTKISLTDELKAQPTLYGRVQLGWDLGRHRVVALVAPLRITANGTLARETRFDDATFAAGAHVDARYKFDTYRLTYRYLALDRKGVRLGVGLTGLLRVAAITLDDGTTKRTKSNIGFVPLLRFELSYRPHRLIGLAVVADGLAARQGRAFDVLTAIQGPVWNGLTPYVGYRFIEGGADNDEVYNFALLHFIAFGVDASLDFGAASREPRPR